MQKLVGSETTSNSLTWILYTLAQHRHVLAKLREEVDAVLREGPLGYESVGRLKYVEMVIKETMRIHPAAPVTARMAVRPQKLLGYTVPAGTNVIVNFMHMHKDPRFWDKPEEFRPERWAEDAPKPTPGAYMPFGDGPKNCIGQRLAMLEMKTVLARIVHALDFELAPDRPVEQILTVTLNAKDGVHMTFRGRAA
eukprot:TRINITY_DN3512_c0_g2_i1.p1 TRINITY_DN3512_c0_g2~~TRINITY_DN3512_c0_g2_i1.p1  ORF type:complete len:195 (-),score=64.30 TRINITY_DN3512_c0_g2_i1:88-672(-)